MINIKNIHIYIFIYVYICIYTYIKYIPKYCERNIAATYD